MPFYNKNIEEKPYNMCLNCVHIGKNCDGPNFLAMEMHRLSEWCKLRKDYLHNLDSKWTNAYIAEHSGVSKVSVDRFMAGKTDDVKMSTIASILKVLVNGTWGQYPCAMASMSEPETVFVDNPALVERLDKADTECKRLQNVLDNLGTKHKEDIDAAVAAEKRKVDFLREQIDFHGKQMVEKDKLLHERYDFLKRKDRIILILSILLAICLITIITALVVDRLNSDIGFFWLDTSAFFENLTNGIHQLTEWRM